MSASQTTLRTLAALFYLPAVTSFLAVPRHSAVLTSFPQDCPPHPASTVLDKTTAGLRRRRVSGACILNPAAHAPAKEEQSAKPSGEQENLAPSEGNHRPGLLGDDGGANCAAGRGGGAVDGGRFLRRGSMFDNVPVQTVSGDGSYSAVLVVPTGIGAAIGGYAGDALPVARAMSSVVDNLITHPNVMNGAMLSAPSAGIQYVEGYALDEFCAGRGASSKTQHLPLFHRPSLVALPVANNIAHINSRSQPVRGTREQAANAARATLGINVAEYCLTEEPVGVTLEMTSSGASWGTVKGLGSLVAAGRRLVDEAGCTAIAVVARFPEDDDEEAFQAYREGKGVDAVGGAEAIISHVMTQKLKVPCAHAPACLPVEADESVSPRACAEELGYTFLPCVLSNLHRAPFLVTSRNHPKAHWALWAEDVDAVVAPSTAFGGAGVLSLAQQDTTLLVAVEENTTVMQAIANDLLGGGASANRCVTVYSYLEALGVLAAHKAGVNPACLTHHIPGIRPLLPSVAAVEDEGLREAPFPQFVPT